MSNPIANSKCYTTSDRSKLVSQGSNEARFLFANKGEEVNISRLESVENASEFFDDLPIAQKAEHPEDHSKKKRQTR